MITSSPPATVRTLRAENAELRARLAEAEDTLRAIRAGDVDALVVEGENGLQIFTLQGLDAEQNRSRGEMLAQVSDAVIAVDNEEHIIFLNASAERQYGVRADEVVGRKLDSVITRHWPSPEAEAEMCTALGERGEWRGELIHSTHDGRELHIEFSSAALRGPGGERIGVVRTIRDVSKRKQLELEKTEALRLLDTLLTHAPVGFVFLDLDLRFVRINDRLAEINGITVAAHLGKTVAEILPTFAPALKQMAARILKTGQPILDQEFTGETTSAPGVTRYWNASWYPVRDERGEIMGFGGVVDEITERKRMEEALAMQQRLYKSVTDNTDVALFIMNDKQQCSFMNPAAEHLTGYTFEETCGRLLHDIVHHTRPDGSPYPLRECPIDQAFPQQNKTQGEEVFVHKDGHFYNVAFTASPLPNDRGIPMGTIIEVQDITERKQAESALRDREEKLREQLAQLALLERITRAINNHLDFKHILKEVTNHLEDSLPVDFCCVCLFDEQARNCEVVQVGIKSTPLAMEMAMPEHTVISLNCVALIQAARGELSYLPDVREMEFPFPQRLAKGGLRSLVLAPVQLEGDVVRFLLVARREVHSFTDGEREFLQQLSEHVALSCHQAKLHNALQTAHDELRRTQQTTMQRERLRALGQMACGITHDISNAISPVTLYTASLLEREPGLSVRARDYLQTIHQSVQNVAESIARMREFSHQGEAQVVLTPIHLNHIAQQALDITRVHWSDSPHERGIVIQPEVRMAEDLPDIMGVESEIRDAIVNLILNAVDAMPGGGTLTLRTKTQVTAPGTGGTPGARQVCLELMDNGIGMDEDTRRRCLEPFFTTKGEHGSGMGLVMVYGMITRHRARIEIESAICQGATVRMLFPLMNPVSKEVDPPLPTIPEPAYQRILFIDDDPLLIKSMRDILEADGHTVVTAAGGQEGIDAFAHSQERKNAFTVVITDLGMPHVDGRKVVRAVKAASPSTPVILLTGWGRRLETEGDILAQVNGILCKPPNLRELREALAACCPLDEFTLTNS